jgi:hypothetical protein
VRGLSAAAAEVDETFTTVENPFRGR